MNKKRKGSWTLVTVVLIPLLLIILAFFGVYSNSKKIMKNRVQNAMDSSSLYLANHGVIYTVKEDDGYKTFCSLQHNTMEYLFDNFVKNGLIKTVDGYNEYWCIKVYENEDDKVGHYITFKELEESTHNYSKVAYFLSGDGVNENAQLDIRVIIPFRKISDYSSYYKKYGVSFTNEEINNLKNWKGGGFFSTPINDWIVFDISSSSSCH